MIALGPRFRLPQALSLEDSTPIVALLNIGAEQPQNGRKRVRPSSLRRYRALSEAGVRVNVCRGQRKCLSSEVR